MALLGNKNKKTIEELEEYYSNKTEKSGMAWAMAFLSLVLTVTVMGGLFFGGRWLYRTVTDDSSSTIVATTIPAAENDTTTPSTSEEEPTTNENGEVGLSVGQGVISPEAARTDTPSTAEAAEANEAVSTETDASTEEVAAATTDDDNEDTTVAALPDTGAGNILVIAPTIALAAGYTISRKYQLK